MTTADHICNVTWCLTVSVRPSGAKAWKWRSLTSHVGGLFTNLGRGDTIRSTYVAWHCSAGIEDDAIVFQDLFGKWTYIPTRYQTMHFVVISKRTSSNCFTCPTVTFAWFSDRTPEISGIATGKNGGERWLHGRSKLLCDWLPGISVFRRLYIHWPPILPENIMQ